MTMVLQCDICLFSVWVPITLKYRQLLIQVHDIDTTNVSSPYEFPLPWNTGNHSSRYMTLILLPQSMVGLNHMNMVSAVTCLFPVWVPIALKHRQLLIQVHDIDTTTNISSPYEFLCLEIQAITHPGTWCWQPCSGSYAFLVCYCCRRGTPTSHTRIDSRWSRWNVARIDRVTNLCLSRF